MKRCEFCGKNLPIHANFCINCGRPFAKGALADHTLSQALATPAPSTPPLLSNLLYPIIVNAETSPRDTDVSVRNRWVEWGMTPNIPQFPERRTDKSGAVLPDLLVPRMLAMQGPVSSKRQAPIVPGNTQGGGVSPVPGSTPPPTPKRPQDNGVSAPPQTTALAQQSRPEHPLYHFEPPVHHPIYLPQPTPPRPTPEPEHHHPWTLHALRSYTSQLYGSAAAATSSVRFGITTKWLIVALATVVVLITSSFILAHALIPTTSLSLTITGSSVVPDGGILHVHGKDFTPSSSVQLTIDNGLSVSFAGQYGLKSIAQRTEKSTHVNGLSSMFLLGEFQPRSAAGTSIIVNSSGAFHADITVPLSLTAGMHTIHVTENPGSQSASLQFTVPSAKLVINPPSLHFGSLKVGSTAKLVVTVSNRGGSLLNWIATVDGSNTNWLMLQNSTGAIEVNGRDEAITVKVNTTHLSVGPHSALLHLHSNGGNATLLIMLEVTAATPTATPTTTPTPQPSPSSSPSPLPSPSPSPSPTPPPPTPSPQITVTPLNLDPTSSNCSPNSDGTYNCSVTVGETAPGTLSWFTYSFLGLSISPPSGTLSASQPQQSVIIASIPCHYARFAFIDQNRNRVVVIWRCKPGLPMLTFNPTSTSNSTVSPGTFSYLLVASKKSVLHQVT